MSIITIVKHNLRRAGQRLRAASGLASERLAAWKITRTEQDIDWARASSDAHIRGLEQTLQQLRAEHDSRSTREVERDVSRAAKAGLFA